MKFNSNVMHLKLYQVNVPGSVPRNESLMSQDRKSLSSFNNETFANTIFWGSFLSTHNV